MLESVIRHNEFALDSSQR